jgi:hypothetical protein
MERETKQLSCRDGGKHDRAKLGKKARMEPTPNSPTQRRKKNRTGTGYVPNA